MVKKLFIVYIALAALTLWLSSVNRTQIMLFQYETSDCHVCTEDSIPKLMSE